MSVVLATILQLQAFHASVVLQSPDTPRTSPSAVEPSPLQNGIGDASTIQFPHLIKPQSGHGNLPLSAACEKHIAPHIPSVSVGEKYILTLFVASHVPSDPQGEGLEHTHGPTH